MRNKQSVLFIAFLVAQVAVVATIVSIGCVNKLDHPYFIDEVNNPTAGIRSRVEGLIETTGKLVLVQVLLSLCEILAFRKQFARVLMLNLVVVFVTLFAWHLAQNDIVGFVPF